MREHSSETPQDVVGLGNAIVDVIAHADDAFLARESMVKGAMTLIELAPGTSLDEIKSKTEAGYRVSLKNN